MLWHCWLGGRKGIRPVKKLRGRVLVWLSVWSEVQTWIWPSWFHCHSLSLASVKSRLVLPFWYRLTRVVPDKGPLNGCACVYREKSHKEITNYKNDILWEFFSVIQKCFHHTKASILVDLVLPSTKGQFQYQAKRLAGKNMEWDVKPQLNQQTKRKLHKYCCDIKDVVSCSYTVLLTSNNYHDTAETP